MTIAPFSFVTFKRTEPRVPVYQLALELAKQLYAVVELAQDVERFYLRDALDRKSTAIPTLIARGLATPDMSERRELYRRARRAVTDCASILDVLQHRGTIADDVVGEAHALTTALGRELDALTVPPPMVR